MSENDSTPPVACTLTAEDAEQRPEWARSVMVETYDGADERDDGYTVAFDGTDESLPAVATFVSNELECCAFAEYTIEVSPPYDETRLTITGPEGTKEVFGGLVDLLQIGGQ